MSASTLASSRPLAATVNRRRRPRSDLLLLLGLVLFLAAAAIISTLRRPATEPTLYAVKGKVLINGEPVENLNVAFHPVAGNCSFCPVGRTNSRGIFHLTTRREADGAPAGDYLVTFVWPDPLIDECDCPDPALHDRLKGVYASLPQSTFQVTVDAAGNTFWFNLRLPAPTPHSP